MFFRMAHVASYNDPYFVFVWKILAVKFSLFFCVANQPKELFLTSVAASIVRSRSECVLTIQEVLSPQGPEDLLAVKKSKFC